MRVDAHQHFWRVSRGDYGWLTADLAPIFRDFGPDDLEPLLARHGIDKTVLVQAAPTVAETRFLLAIARVTPFVAGVVGCVDFDARGWQEDLRRLADDRLLLGIRPMVQGIADDDWLARPVHAPIFEDLVAQGLVFDALVLPRHLSRLQVVAERHPTLSIVLDHLAKPPIASGALFSWQYDINRLAACPNVVCKLSGMVTEAGPDWTVERLRPFAEAVLDAFGPERLLWGSDWPVVELAGGYDRWRAVTEQLLAGLPGPQRQAILGDNAARVYLGGKRGK